jgi:flavin prenyltransferase
LGGTAVTRVIVGITGASGTIYGVRVLEALKAAGIDTHLVMTEAACRMTQLETRYTTGDIEALASHSYANGELDAPIASGSFRTSGMIVAPCSIESLSAITHSHNDSLVARAADVMLKERRKLVLVVRETPLHLGHLHLMVEAAECGAVMLDQFGVDHDLYQRWGEG